MTASRVILPSTDLATVQIGPFHIPLALYRRLSAVLPSEYDYDSRLEYEALTHAAIAHLLALGLDAHEAAQPAEVA